jgi:hypothetical protein
MEHLLLETYLKQLRLPTFLANYRRFARLCNLTSVKVESTA